MVAWATFIGGWAVFMALAILLYRRLPAAMASGRIGAALAVLIYWAVLAVLLFPVWAVFGALSIYLYTNYPSLRVAAWDVGVPWTVAIGFACSVFTGIVIALLFSWRVLSGKRRSNPANHGVGSD